jgi:hypothetical protein
MMRYCLSLAVLGALAACGASFAAEIPDPPPDVVFLLPSDNEVAGWEIYPDTLVYVEGDELTQIYDGGFELYKSKGALRASQQMYKKGSLIATVTIDGMSSMNSAKNIFKYFQKTDKKLPTYKKLWTLTESYIYSADGSSNGNLYRYTFFATVMVNAEGTQGRQAAESFLKAISWKYMKLAKH